MSPLHYLGNFLRELLGQIPLGVARALFVAALAALLLWVLSLPGHQVKPPGPSGPLSENLRIWAAVALLIQITIYLLL